MVLHELLSREGHTPFAANVMEHPARYTDVGYCPIDPSCGGLARDVVAGLLRVNPVDRLDAANTAAMLAAAM